MRETNLPLAKFLQRLVMSGEGENSGIDLKLFVQAVQEQFRALNTRLDNLQSPSRLGGFRRAPLEEEEEEGSDYDMNSSSRGKKAESKRDGNLGSIKMTIPTFQGKNDPELYLKWERKVQHVFDCHNYSEEKNVKLTAIEFTKYASIWWDQFTISIQT